MFGNNVSRRDAGDYTCTAGNPEKSGPQSTIFTLHIRYGPDNVILTPSNSVYTENVGHRLNDINCSSDCYPACAYRWTKQNGLYMLNGNMLKLEVLTKEERGTYVCTASTQGTTGTATSLVTINVRYGPETISLSPVDTSHTVVEGHHLENITCSAECYPGCSQYWRNVSDTTNKPYGPGGILSLGVVSRYYKGEYICTCTNQAQQYPVSMEKSVYVTVQYFPDVAVFLENGTRDDESVTFLCTATGEPAEYTFYSWVHIAPDKITHIQTYDGSASGNKNRLTLPDLSYMDSGTYRCNVTNTVKDFSTDSFYATNEIIFTKKGEPQIFPMDSRIAAAIGSSIKLSTSFYSNDNINPVVSWFKVDNDTKVEITNDTEKYSFDFFETSVKVLFYSKEIQLGGNKTQLEIIDIKPSDFGTYQIQINNSVGTNSTMFVVVSKGPPEVPKYFSVLPDSSTSSSISLKWRSGFHGGANQTFYIEYRKIGSLEWQLGPDKFGGDRTDKQFSATVNDLSSDTSYEFQIYARNRYNTSHVTSTKGNTTLIQQEPIEPPDSLIGPAVGGVVGVIALITIAVAVGVAFMRKRKLQSTEKGDSNGSGGQTDRHHLAAAAPDDIEINLNPMYESAGSIPSVSNNNDVYAEVKKPKKQPCVSSDNQNNVYSEVKKDRLKNTTEGGLSDLYSTPVKPTDTTEGGLSDLYSTPVKPTGKPKKAKKEKAKKKIKQKESKHGRSRERSCMGVCTNRG